MVGRTKMPRINRAAQFAPFDALKGLSDALRLKEYQREREIKGDITEELALKMSTLLINLEKADTLIVKYYEDGKNKIISGKAKVFCAERYIRINSKNIDFDSICDLEIKKN